MFFDPLTADEVLTAIGRTMRSAAAEQAPDEFARAQLLSAHSSARLLASELRDGPALVRDFVAAVGADLRATGSAAHGELADRIAAASSDAGLAAVVAEAVAADGPHDATARVALRRRVAELGEAQMRMFGARDVNAGGPA